MILISVSNLYLDYAGSDSGNAYAFDDDNGSPELVTKLFTEDELQRAPTQSRDIENLFGIEDSIITRFGSQVFEKSSNDLVIRYSHDLLPDPKVWCTRKAKRAAKVFKEQKKEFNSKQSALMEAGVSITGEDILSKEKQIQKYVPDIRRSCRKVPVDRS